MASSDEEGEVLPQCVTNYCLVYSDNCPVMLSSLPLQSSASVGLEFSKSVFLSGMADSGMDKIFKEVVAWKFELSYVHPEILVQCKSKNWIKLETPRKSYEGFVRSILVTVHLLHMTKKDPDAPFTSLWRQLQKLFSTFEEGPSEKDILHHIDLISATLSVDKDLFRSKYLLSILKRSYGKEVTSFENAVPTARTRDFVLDDEISDAEQNNDSEDDMNELFDCVCAICDDGGTLLCCDGRCMRSFHATMEDGRASGCESLGFSNEKVNAISSFLCQNCIDQRHQCFACGRLGSSEVGSAQVFPCISATCGRFYHPTCVARLFHPEDVTKAANLQNKITKGESFTCSAHVCAVCKQLEDMTSQEIELQFAVCRRCPTSYHRKCMPKSIRFEGTSDSPIRAWDGLLKKHLLIYCMNHIINQELGTPDRDHIVFSATQRSRMEQTSQFSRKMMHIPGSNMYLPKRIGSHIPRPVEETRSSSSQESFSPMKCLKNRFSKHTSNYSGTLSKSFQSGTDASRRFSASSTLVDELLGRTSSPQITQGTDRDLTRKNSKDKIRNDSSWSNTDSVEERIAALMKKSDAVFNESKFRSNMFVVSTHSNNHRPLLENAITQGRVDASVKAVREALRKLEEGGTLEEAKAICEPQVLNQIMAWKRKLTVYLGPFLHGKRYTSYGRHFTKFEKLQEVVNRLHNYVLDGDTIVDFCCGSNDFSCLMKKKLDETGKHCSFRNYDIIKPKNDFCFENRDWMTVTPKELPAGSKLIMGLNPPFGTKASLANKFINKALEFKPKLLILIVPAETKRLDSKGAYELIWEDRKIFSGKAFYLPGSLDVHDKQIEQWNNSPPPLYLWSHSDWSNTHMSIANQHGHNFTDQKEADQRDDSGAPTLAKCLMEESNDCCYQDFSHVVPENADLSSVSDGIPDLGNSSEHEHHEGRSIKKRKFVESTSISHSSARPNLQTYIPVPAQPNPYFPRPMLQHNWYGHGYGTSNYSNSFQNQGYSNYQANFPQAAYAQYVPQYMPPLFQSANANDDLPPIPGLGVYPRGPRPC